MNEAHLQLLRETMNKLARRRDKERQAFRKFLMMLATGAMTVLVSLHSPDGTGNTPATGSTVQAVAATCPPLAARALLSVAWGSLGLGILLGALAIHVAAWTPAETLRQGNHNIKSGSCPPGGNPFPTALRLPWLYRAAIWLFPAALVLAVLSLTAYAILREWV